MDSDSKKNYHFILGVTVFACFFILLAQPQIASAAFMKIKKYSSQIGEEISLDNIRELYSMKKPAIIQTRELGRELKKVVKQKREILLTKTVVDLVQQNLFQKMRQNQDFSILLQNISTGKVQIDIDKINHVNNLLIPQHLSHFEEKLIKLPSRKQIALIPDFVHFTELRPASIKTINLIKHFRGGNKTLVFGKLLLSVMDAPVLLKKAKEKIGTTIHTIFSRQRTWNQFAKDTIRSFVFFFLQYPLVFILLVILFELRRPIFEVIIERGDWNSFLDKVIDLICGEEEEPPKKTYIKYRPERRE